MRRVLLSMSGTLVALSVSSAAPGPKADDNPPPYFPVTVGTVAVYQTTIGDLKMEGAYRVTKAEKTGATVRVTIERGSGGKPAVQDQTDVSAKGLSLVQFGDRAIEPPAPLLRLPAKAGDTWKWEAEKKEGAPAQKTTYKVIGEEEIEVPAGKFKAIRVEQTTETNGRTARYEEWYAPRVGLVKKVFHHLGTTKQVQELKSLTIEKK